MRCPWVTPRTGSHSLANARVPALRSRPHTGRTQGLVAGEGGLPASPARGDPALQVVLVSRGRTGLWNPRRWTPTPHRRTAPRTAERGCRVPWRWASAASSLLALPSPCPSRAGKVSVWAAAPTTARGLVLPSPLLSTSTEEAGDLTAASALQCASHLGPTATVRICRQLPRVS